jgi:flagellar protein FlaJ
MSFFESYKRLSMRIFGGLARESYSGFSSIKVHLIGASINVLLETYVAMVYMTTVLVYAASLAAILIASRFILFDFMTFLYLTLFIPVMMASMAMVFMYVYPIQKSSKIRNSIDSNLPFALAHMSAICSSGIPPEFMFELLTGFKEYGEISKQSSIIVRNIKTFGMSSVNAIVDVAKRTPSPSFRQILSGIQSTIEKGGNLTEYLEEMSERSLFEYRINRENYLKTLSTYADMYTAVLITAPVMMIIVLGIMSVIGGDIMGMAATDLIFLMTWVIVPLLNITFLAFLHTTHPSY